MRPENETQDYEPRIQGIIAYTISESFTQKFVHPCSATG
jgi:hypothetical protein